MSFMTRSLPATQVGWVAAARKPPG
jgi:hypothetical protein